MSEPAPRDLTRIRNLISMVNRSKDLNPEPKHVITPWQGLLQLKSEEQSPAADKALDNGSVESVQTHGAESSGKLDLVDLENQTMLDDNDNQVECSTLVHTKSGGLVQRSVLPEGLEFEEEIEPLAVNTQEGSDDDRSVIWTDDSSVVSVLSSSNSDSHGNCDCERGGPTRTRRSRMYHRRCDEY